MYHVPLTWYEQENLGYKAQFETWPQSTVVLASTLVSQITKILRVSPTGRYKGSQTPKPSAFLSSLGNSVCERKGMC